MLCTPVCVCWPNLSIIKKLTVFAGCQTTSQHRSFLITLHCTHISSFRRQYIETSGSHCSAHNTSPRQARYPPSRITSTFTSTAQASSLLARLFRPDNTNDQQTTSKRPAQTTRMFAATVLQLLAMITNHYIKRFLLTYMFNEDLQTISEDGEHELREQAGIEIRRRVDTWECWDCQTYDLQASIQLEKECPCCLHRVEETVFFECACGWSNDHDADPWDDPWEALPFWELPEVDRLGRENQ